MSIIGFDYTRDESVNSAKSRQEGRKLRELFELESKAADEEDLFDADESDLGVLGAKRKYSDAIPTMLSLNEENQTTLRHKLSEIQTQVARFQPGGSQFELVTNGSLYFFIPLLTAYANIQLTKAEEDIFDTYDPLGDEQDEVIREKTKGLRKYIADLVKKENKAIQDAGANGAPSATLATAMSKLEHWLDCQTVQDVLKPLHSAISHHDVGVSTVPPNKSFPK